MKHAIRNILITIVILTPASALALDLDQATLQQEAEASQILSTLGHQPNQMTKKGTEKVVTVALIRRKRTTSAKH